MSSTDSFEKYESRISSYDSTNEIIGDSLSPFNLRWAFGLNSKAPVINLGTKTRSLIAYVCSHATVLYDYKAHKMFLLQGHRGNIQTLSVNKTGKWLLTASFDDHSYIIVWNTESRLPSYTLVKPHGDYGMTAATLSPDGKYIITVGKENFQLVKLWLWTGSNQTPGAQAEINDVTTDYVKDISFCYENSNLMALTREHQVLFLTWNESSGLLKIIYPPILKKPSKPGIFNNTSFISETTKVFTGTTYGYVLIWDIENRNTFKDDVKITHVKSVHLQTANITKIVNYKGLIVVGNSKGEINFYDVNLKILYWCRNCGLDTITSISFDVQSELARLEPDCADDTAVREIHVESTKNLISIPSNVTTKIEYQPKPKTGFKIYSERVQKFQALFDDFKIPRDATLVHKSFCIDKFIVATMSGKLAWIDVSTLSCRFISHYCDSPLTSIDIYPDSDYLVIANKNGQLFLFNQKNHQLMFTKDIPPLPDLIPTLKTEVLEGTIIHVSKTDVNKNQKLYSTALKYSIEGDALICGMNNGVIWVLHPDTLDPLDPSPFKHSSAAIIDIVFSKCSKFMAYYDDLMTVAVFKKNEKVRKKTPNLYYFIGKYRSHNLRIREILFGSPLSDNSPTPRLLTLGEDQVIIEYDLAKSGPYPEPGLLISKVTRVEEIETPFCMTWCPDGEKTLLVSNSDHKFKLIDAITKETRSTILGPKYCSPVKRMLIEKVRDLYYMLFATDKEIGLQILPVDGNPYKIIGKIGHPHKISWLRISSCGRFLFTAGRNDQCAFIWNIDFKSADIMYQLGGSGLQPFYGCIHDGKGGWLFNEMQDLFIFAQVLQQGVNSMKTKRISNYVSIEQLPNLMRAFGFYPTPTQLKNLINEVIFKINQKDDKTKQISFDELVKIYINHRPSFGILMRQLETAFHILATQDVSENSIVIQREFLNLLRKQVAGNSQISNENRGESLTMQEIETYLKQLILRTPAKKLAESLEEEALTQHILQLLPNHISYKDFAIRIMGIKSAKETRAENDEYDLL